MADVVDITLVEFPGPLVLERFYATDASQCPLIHADISSDTSFYCQPVLKHKDKYKYANTQSWAQYSWAG